MRYWLTIAVVAVMSCLFSPVTPAQQSRSLTVLLDTVRLNVCGPKEFLMPVSIGDVPLQDSLVGARIYLAWDVQTIEFDDLVITSSETIGYTFSRKTATRDKEAGWMFIEMGDTNLKPATGSDKPLFYLSGRVKAADTVDGLYGWVQVLSVSFESSVRYTPIDLGNTGYVRVVRDTTPGFTATLSSTTGSFDTLRADTITLSVQNTRDRRVKEIRFGIKADTNHYEFADTIETGTLAGTVNWNVKELSITPDAIEGRFQSDTDLNAEGALIKIVLRRKNDSAFASTLTVDRFSVNRESCLGRLVRQSAQVSGETISKKDTGTSFVGYDWRKASESIRLIPSPQGEMVTIIAEDLAVVEVMIVDMWGGRLSTQPMERIDASTLRVRFEIPPPSGTYFVALRDRNGIGYKQFTIIK